MKNTEFAIPQYTTANELRRIRKLLGLTQKEFALLTGVSKPTIERWETTDKKITGPIVLTIKMLEAFPDYVDGLIIPPKEYPLRLKYMHRQNLCTIIDVDEVKQSVKIINYTNNLLFRAFGVNTTPTFADYEEFLESRCFPHTRDKMKLILEDLNLPVYDPFLIIQKTQGRMAEDHFWIEIEI